MSWYFTAMKHVTHSFKADERIVWIEISGLPLNAWTSKAFKKIAGSWGKSHNVCVKEFAGWVLDIKGMESKSSKNSEADNSVDDDFNDNVNDRDPNEVEEGKIHVVNDDHENDVVQDTQWPVDVDEQPENHADSPIILENHMQDPIKPTVNHNHDWESFLKPPGEIAMGKFQFDFAVSPSIGRSGGLASIWDTNVFSKLNIFPFENLLIVEGIWRSSDLHYFMINVYAPQDDRKMKCCGIIFWSTWRLIQDTTLFLEILMLSDLLRNGLELFLTLLLPMPILLSSLAADFGPIPFKFYNSWLFDSNLQEMVKDFLEHHDHYTGQNPIEKKALLENIKVFDANIASRSDNFVLDSQRTEWLTKLRNIESNENSDSIQKAKIKWGIEADENSKTDVANIVTRSPFYRRIQDDQNVALTSPTCKMEIRNAIWDCGSDKSPRPDGFSFAFYKTFWDFLKYDIMGFVQKFFKLSYLPRGCNASFPKVHNPMVITDFWPISLIGAQYKIIAKVLANRLAQVIDSVICQEQTAFVKNRQILDGPLMVSEAIHWCKRKHSKLLISGCLNNATSSILINGSPTREFNIQRGLRQGDPLSPFLFIIAMEGLHVAIEDAIVAGLYRGLKAFKEFYNFEKRLEIIQEFMLSNGPFDGVLGFSQWTLLTTAIPGIQREGVALSKVPKVKFVILASSAKIGGSKFGIPKLASDAYSTLITTMVVKITILILRFYDTAK
nr:RNA-directed DNA polymerase, eukaryota, reverse transcriptase zinc-binding domain protein [Tanacetum cinerariifolium]